MRGFATGVGVEADIGPPAADPTLVYEYTTRGLKALRKSGGSGNLRGPAGATVPRRGGNPTRRSRAAWTSHGFTYPA